MAKSRSVPDRGPSPEAPAEIAFSRPAWDDYQYWVQNDRAVARRIARLIDECLRHPFRGAGNSEPLKHELAGYWSRRITQEHRLVYRVSGGRCVIAQCRYHY